MVEEEEEDFKAFAPFLFIMIPADDEPGPAVDAALLCLPEKRGSRSYQPPNLNATPKKANEEGPE